MTRAREWSRRREWGEKVANVISGVGDWISELNQLLQESSVAQRGMLGQMQRMVWLEDRLQTSLHLINRNLELMVDNDLSPVIGVVGDRGGESEVAKVDKGKGKEVMIEKEKSEKSEVWRGQRDQKLRT